tara:strand:- start:992 stop:1165 length:174 start_codon:yes stop_codon:yes gene_type:complete
MKLVKGIIPTRPIINKSVPHTIITHTNGAIEIEFNGEDNAKRKAEIIKLLAVGFKEI